MASVTNPAGLIVLADQCVKCGLCLPHCPTYRLDSHEAESPRGRIALAAALAAGEIPASPEVDRHLDHCLGCLRCQQVCPAGVDYAGIIDGARHQQRQRRATTPGIRAIEALCARPAALDLALGLYRTAFRAIPSRFRRLPRPPAARSLPAADDAETAVFVGCVAKRYENPTRAALIALCQAAGVKLAMPRTQTCCGALHRHGGNPEAAEALAQRNRQAFDPHATVLTLASGCHAALADALAPGVRVVDALRFLADRLDRLRFAPATGRVALHLPCTQRLSPDSVAALRALLLAVPDLDLIELPDTGCCGAAGSHMLSFADRAASLRAPLLDTLHKSGADTLISANIGCRMHLDQATGATVMHPIDFLAQQLT
jgi:glycolate oxidase iron-sulfur subunit